MPVSVWSKVAVVMQSALSSAQVISAITKANPGVVTYVGADPTNGDYLLLTDVLGMDQVNSRAFRAANVVGGSNTLELEGENTTSYDTLTSGNLQVVTLGTSISTILNCTVSGGDPAFIDTTTIHDSVNQQIIGNFTPTVVTGDLIWDPANTAQAAMKAASDNKEQRVFRFTFANGTKWLFYGYVGLTGAPTGSAQEVVKTPLIITTNGRLTTYAT